jgi:hypothetical protein
MRKPPGDQIGGFSSQSAESRRWNARPRPISLHGCQPVCATTSRLVSLTKKSGRFLVLTCRGWQSRLSGFRLRRFFFAVRFNGLLAVDVPYLVKSFLRETQGAGCSTNLATTTGVMGWASAGKGVKPAQVSHPAPVWSVYHAWLPVRASKTA